VTEWSDTANGSASTAISSGTPSGTGISIESCAGRYSAKPPEASLQVPVWMPAANGPSAKCQQMLRSPSRQDPHGGSIPLGPQESHGLRTTRWPISNPSAASPSSLTSATTSWPITTGKEKKVATRCPGTCR
jgi:hypothetical protein